jgi:TonB family protein
MLEQLEQQVVEEQRVEPQLVTAPAYPLENDQRQRRRMVIALMLLLVALGLVLVKDRDFWFPSTPDVADSDADDATPAATADTTATATSTSKPAIPLVKKQRGHIAAAKPVVTTPVAAAPPISATRAVLPPLRVEVVAGDRNQPVRPGSPSVKVDLGTGVSPTVAAPSGTEVASSGATSVTNAGERVQMSTDARQALAARPVRPEYPLLARQMKVQGAVVLDAMIAKDGGIQSLKVVGGPSILADAAQEAVKQWRFKPYYQDGQPVETQARITVNFSIFTNSHLPTE